MLISRGLPFLRAANTLRVLKAKGSPSQVSVRNMSGHTWYYREGAPPNPIAVKGAEIIGAFFWWWVLWHLFTEPGHILGEFEYPDARKWTDAELGISSD